MAAFVFATPVKKAKAELQELVATVDQMLTINIPTALNFNVNTIDEAWHEIPFQVGISSNNKTGYTFFSDVVNVMYNSQHSDKSIKLNEQWSITYPSGAVAETTTHITYPSSDNSALDKKYDYKLRVLASSNVTNGTYTGSMSFFATANPTPSTIAYINYLDEVNNDIVFTMTPGKFYQLKDRRDNKKYWIVFEQGELKMAQNLDLDLTAGSSLSTTYTNTNFTPTNGTMTGSTLEESWVADSVMAQSYDEGIIYRPSADDAYSSINACVHDGYSEWECYRSAGGNYYNWYAAHGINDGSRISFSVGSTYPNDICPKGWHLPTTAEEGYQSAITPEDRNTPGKVRCIGIKPSHMLTITIADHINTSYSEYQNNQAWGYASFVLPSNIPYTADSSHELAGWSKNAKSSIVDYAKGALYQTDKESATLYAVWRDKKLTLNDITTMQEMTPTIIRETPHGTTKQLIDIRDNKKYWVTKYGGTNGDIIMTQNLDFDAIANDDKYLYSSTTDYLSNGSWTYGYYYEEDYDFEGGDWYYANGITRTAVSGFTNDDVRWHYHIGNYYSYPAAKLGNTYDSNQISSTNKSICPKGWGIPTTKEFSRIRDYYDSYNSTVPMYLLKAGGYLLSKGIVTSQDSQARYLLNDMFTSGYYRYAYYYYFDRYDSRPYSDYYSAYRYSSNNDPYYNQRHYASFLRCIARRDINVNNYESRLEVRANSHN